MKIQKGVTKLLMNVLAETRKISFPDGRIRDAILRQLQAAHAVMESDRMAILTRLATKKNGEYVMKQLENGDSEYTFTEKNKAKFSEEYEVLCEEYIEIECDSEKLRYFVDRTSYEPGPFEAEFIEKIFDSVPEGKNSGKKNK